MSQRVDLDVPYSEKDQAKALGAWWDPAARTWYVPAGKDPRPFSKWIPESSELLELLPPIFVVESRSACWKCGRQVTVGTVAATSFIESGDDTESVESDLYLFSGITHLPKQATEALQALNSGYRRRFSKTAGTKYFMNHCPCGAQLGDFFMHSEPGGAFLPIDAKAAASIKLHCISDEEPVELAGDPGFNFPNLIKKHAQRV